MVEDDGMWMEVAYFVHIKFSLDKTARPLYQLTYYSGRGVGIRKKTENMNINKLTKFRNTFYDCERSTPS